MARAPRSPRRPAPRRRRWRPRARRPRRRRRRPAPRRSPATGRRRRSRRRGRTPRSASRPSPAWRRATALTTGRSSRSIGDERPRGVEVLGRRHRDPRGAQLADEGAEQVEHQARFPSSSLVALSMSDWYLSSTCSVSAHVLRRRARRGRARRACAPSRGSRRPTAPCAGRAGAASARPRRSAGASAAETPGHPRQHDRALALDVGVAEVQVQAAALQRLGELAGVVGREEDERQLGGHDACRARGSRPGSPRAPPRAAPRSRPRRGRPRR